MPTIKKVYEINASVEDVFQALVDADIIEEWSGDEAKMGPNVGDTFSLWGGQMFGENLEVIPNQKIVQEWCYDKWRDSSKVTFTLSYNNNKTIVELIHEDVPEESLNSISVGWDTYYLGAIQEMFDTKLNKIKP